LSASSDEVVTCGCDRLGPNDDPCLRANESRRQRIRVPNLGNAAGQEPTDVLAFRHFGGEGLVETRRRRTPHPLESSGHTIGRIDIDVLRLRDRDLERDPKGAIEDLIPR
jgi:hypothetical protein